MKFSLAGASHIGGRTENQDYFCLGPNVSQGAGDALEISYSGDEFQKYGLLCAVADGMGGVAGGAFAARSVLENLSGVFYDAKYGTQNLTSAEFLHDFKKDLSVFKHRVWGDLLGESRNLPSVVSLDAGATLAGIALLPPNLGAVFWCGDARVLRFSGGYLRQITRDHSPLWDAVTCGELTEAEAALSPLSSRVSRAVGAGGDSRVEIESLEWDAGDSFLLCSDGVHGLGRGLRAVGLRDILRETQEFLPLESAQTILARALETDGRDNATLALLRVI